MDYPRELNLSEDIKQALISYLNTEIQNHEAERSPWVSDLKQWQEDYWAEAKKNTNDFPFKGASNLTIPLTAIAVEAIHARTMTKMFGLPQFTSIQALPPFDVATGAIEKSIDHILLKDVDIYAFADSTLLENKKLGSCVGKVGYEKIVKKAVRIEGDSEREFLVVTKQGAVADPVPLARFLMPLTCTDPQMAPWCGEEHQENPYRIKILTDSGFFKKEVWDDLQQWIGSSQQGSSAEYTDKVRELQSQQPIQWPSEISWHEIWLSFDVDGDGREEEIVVHYHKPSQTIWSVRYNWWHDLRRPYRTGKYLSMEHRWAGIGIAKQNEQFQREVTIQHRQRIDNATLANIRMFKIKNGIGYGPGEPIFPGKIWLVDDMEDIGDVQLGEIYPSAYNNEQQAVLYSQQRTGVNEATLGMPSSGTPDTATGVAAKAQESQHKFDYTYGNEKRFLTEICMDVLCATAQFGMKDARVIDYLSGANAPLVKQFLMSDPAMLRNQIILDFQLAGQKSNNMLDRNNFTQLAQTTQQYYTGMIQLAQMLGQPQLMQVIAQKGMIAATEAFKQILESFDVRSVDRWIIQELLNSPIMGQTPVQPNGPPALPPGPGISEGPSAIG